MQTTFFIKDCNGKVIGNQNGYKTHASAMKQVNTKTSRVYKEIWGNFYKKYNAPEKMSQNGNLIYSIDNASR